jgi:hypothetical protein
LLRAWAAKSGGDDNAAEFDGHVVVGRFGFRGVAAGPGPVIVTSSAACPCSAYHTVTALKQISPNGTVRSKARRVRLRASPTGVGEGLLDSPACGVARYQIFCGRLEIGGHQRESVAAIVTVAGARLIVAHQNDGSAAE